MARLIELYFDYTCPYAYLASTQAERLAERAGAELAWRPMLLGGVFRERGTPQRLFETLSPAKARHNGEDMARWADAFGVPLTMPSGHPLRSVEALRATIASGCDPRVIHGFFRAYWVEGRPPSDEATMRDVLSAAGHDAAAILARIGEAAIKDDLRARTDRAVALGVFGAPAWFVDGGPLIWGQDRLPFVAEAAGLPRASAPLDVLFRPLSRTEPNTAKHVLEIYWDFSSPFAYLGATQAKKVAERTGAELVWRPMLLGGVFKSIGQAMVPLATWSEAKQRYYLEDIKRWAAYWDVPFTWPSKFPMNSLKAMRAYLALPEARRDAFRDAVFRAYWAEDQDIADDATLARLVGDDAAAILEKTQDPTVKDALVKATEHAVAAGVFGAPTWVVDGKDLYWGQDRLVLVERALSA